METLFEAFIEMLTFLIGFPIMMTVMGFLMLLSIALVERYYRIIKHNLKKRRSVS